EEHKLRVFENRVLRRIFGPKRDEVTGGWRKLHNEELHNLYSSPSIIRIIKPKRMKWAGYVARIWEKKNAYRILVEKPEGKRTIGKLLNVHRVSYVMQAESDTDEPLIPDPSRFEVESALAKLKGYKSPGSDQIPTELIQAGGEILRSKVQNLITSIWHKKKLPDQWKESIIIPVHKKGDKTYSSNYRGISLLSTSYKILSNILL
ncbi:hypothetical protein B7P43_G08967, partial [Cryptotermes secundus]